MLVDYRTRPLAVEPLKAFLLNDIFIIHSPECPLRWTTEKNVIPEADPPLAEMATCE